MSTILENLKKYWYAPVIAIAVGLYFFVGKKKFGKSYKKRY